MTTRPVAVNVSAATRLYGSCSRQASRIASDTWSAILSGWPSVTDSEVNRKRSLNFAFLPIQGLIEMLVQDSRDLPELSPDAPHDCDGTKERKGRAHPKRLRGKTNMYREASAQGCILSW